MGLSYHPNFGINITPSLPPGTKVGFNISPFPLFVLGLNIPVAISTATADSSNPEFDKTLISSASVMAHLDTGATITSIDIKLAEYLKLISTGSKDSLTAGGKITMPTYAIDLYFPNTTLSPFINLPIGSCNLNFDINKSINDPQNFAILLGRDVLSRWNIVWNGPTSTVLIND